MSLVVESPSCIISNTPLKSSSSQGAARVGISQWDREGKDMGCVDGSLSSGQVYPLCNASPVKRLSVIGS